jgi:putative molybdopterin biosynthesis protein
MDAGKPYSAAMHPRLESTLGAHRHARGWSQEKLAGFAGITRQSYAAIENGRAVPSAEVALRLARALGCAVETLFRLPDAGRPPLSAHWAGPPPAGPRRVRLARIAGRLLAFPLDSGRALLPADGVGSPDAAGGAVVTLLDARPPEPALVAVGCDPAFALVAEALRSTPGGGAGVLWLPRGSRAALEALARGEAHVAGIHLRDPASGAYNLPWVRRVVPFPCTTVRFAVWEQALVTPPGNPAEIRSVADLARPGVRLLNREPGSGSRDLLDTCLREDGVPPAAVAGYDAPAARSHLAVAEAVASGLAGAGVAIRAVAEPLGLGILPLAHEPYDLVIPDHFLELPGVRALLDQLRRPSLRAQVEALGGYDAAGMGGVA